MLPYSLFKIYEHTAFIAIPAIYEFFFLQEKKFNINYYCINSEFDNVDIIK